MRQQPQTTTLSELKKPAPPLDPSIKAGFDTVGGFDLIQRTAKLFAASDIVPQQFQGNLPNCVIAVDMALRLGANPLMVDVYKRQASLRQAQCPPNPCRKDCRRACTG